MVRWPTRTPGTSAMLLLVPDGRSPTGSRGRLIGSDLAQLRVERVAQAVAEEVEGEDGHEDGEARKIGEVVGDADEAASGREHRPPFGRRRLGPEADEAQARRGQDRGTEAHREI